MKLQILPLTLTSLALFALSACQGAEAVEELGKIKDKTCSCEGDQACIDEATKMVEDWVTKYKDARGGDQAKAEEHMNAILECSPAVALAFAAAVE
jgi:hypothetical protein